MNELSPTTKALLRAARDDGPGATARSQDLERRRREGGGRVGARRGAGTKVAVSAATAKLFVMGALLGSAVTVGVAAMVLHAVGSTHAPPDPTVVVHADTETEALAPAARPAAAAIRTSAERPAPAAARPRRAARAGRDPSTTRSTWREAELVAEARGAVDSRRAGGGAQRDPRGAGAPRTRARARGALARGRALRALGKIDAANAADARLRAQFPDNALAR